MSDSSKKINIPVNTCELFVLLEHMTPKELSILDTLVYLSNKYENNITASREKKALNSGCSKRTINYFYNKYEGVIFSKKQRFNKTNIVHIFESIRTELINLKSLINHLKNFKTYKLELGYAVMIKELSFNDLYTEIGGAIKKSKLFITLKKELKRNKIVHRLHSHREKEGLMNKNDTQKCPPNDPKIAPYITLLTLQERAYEPFLKSPKKKNHVYKVLEKYQMLEQIKPEKIKAWEKYSEKEIEQSLQCLFYAMRNPKIDVNSIEAYVYTALKNKYVAKH